MMERLKAVEIEKNPRNIERSKRVKSSTSTSSSSASASSTLTAIPIPIPNLHVICSDLLPQILSEVETTDLIRFRFVSKFWKFQSDRLLEKRGDHKLVFEYSRKKNSQGKNTFVLKQQQQKQRQRQNKHGSNSQDQDENENEESSDSDIDPEEVPDKKLENEDEKVVVKETDFSLTRFLSLFSPASFPCVRFGFIGRKFSDKDLLAFFSKYGSRIEQLDLEWDRRENRWMGGEREFPEKWTTHRTLTQLLCLNQTKLTRLETLRVSGDFSDRGTDNKPESFDNIQNSLPLLSILDLEADSNQSGETRRIIQTLLSNRAAPNLRKIYLPKRIKPREILPFFTPKEIQRFSFRGFQDFSFSIFSSFSIEMLQQIDQLCPGLEYLLLLFDRPPKNQQMAERALQIFQSLLGKSRESLKSISIHYGSFIFMVNALALGFGFVPECSTFSLSFKNVRFMEFRDCDEPLDQILPLEYFPFRNQIETSLSLKSTFPCLESVSFSLMLDRMEQWFPFAKNNANANEKLETVKRLNWWLVQRDAREVPNPYVVNVLNLFPNLENLRLWYIYDFPQVAPQIWPMRRLKHLDLLIQIGKDVEANSFPSLDSAFTGFSKKTVHMILGGNLDLDLQAKDQMESQLLKNLRENPSILNLKGLRMFKLSFSDSDGGVASYNFITRVTRDFAFKWMKRVQIKITITPPEDSRDLWDQNDFAVASLDNVSVKLVWI